MTSTEDSEIKTFVTIRLKGLKTGISPDDIVPALQQLFPKKTKEELRHFIEKAPLVLSRKSTKERAIKISQLLESKGAIMDISENNPPLPREEKPAIKSKGEETGSGPVPSEPKDRPSQADRRRKPRIHKSIDLHPMGIGEILDRSFKLLKEHFLTFFIIILIPQAIYFLMTKTAQIFLFQGAVEAPDLGAGIGIGISVFIAAVIFVILQFWAQGALIYAVSERYMGHGASIGSSYGAIKKRLGKILGTMILMVILLGLLPAIIGIVMAIFVPILIKIGANMFLISSIAVILGILLIVIFVRNLLNWILVDKVVVIEDTAWKRALRRSKELMTTNPEKGFFKKTKMKVSLIILIGIVIAFAAGLLIQLPGFLFTFIFKGSLIFSTIIEILNLAIHSIVTVFTAIAMILFYYDIRQRKEGFDLKMMAENL